MKLKSYTIQGTEGYDAFVERMPRRKTMFQAKITNEQTGITHRVLFKDDWSESQAEQIHKILGFLFGQRMASNHEIGFRDLLKML